MRVQEIFLATRENTHECNLEIACWICCSHFNRWVRIGPGRKRVTGEKRLHLHEWQDGPYGGRRGYSRNDHEGLQASGRWHHDLCQWRQALHRDGQEDVRRQDAKHDDLRQGSRCRLSALIPLLVTVN